MSYVNSLSQTLYLQQVMKTQNTDLTKLQSQIATGQKATDFGGYTASEGRLSMALRGNIQRNDEYLNTVAALQTRTQLTETSLTSVRNTLIKTRDTMIALATATTSDEGASIRATAKSALTEAIGRFNFQLDNTSLFAGRTTGSGSYPIADETTLSNLVDTALTGPYASAAAARAAVDSVFGVAGTGANLTQWFKPGDAGGASGAISISDDRTLASVSNGLPNQTKTGTIDPATGAVIDPTYFMRDTISALAAVAYATPADFAGVTQADKVAAYKNFLTDQIKYLNLADKQLIEQTTINGQYRATLDREEKSLKNQTTILQSILSKVETEEPATAITNLQNLQTQLQSTYQVTSTLRNLSLVNFLR